MKDGDQPTETLTLRATALAYGGECIAVAEGPSQFTKKVLVAGVIPGEVFDARIVREEKRLARAELVALRCPGPERVVPPCPYFGACGGCDLQHMTIAVQRREKLAMVRDTLAYQGGLVARNGVHLLGPDLPEYGYRRRLTLHVNRSGEIGFYRAGTGDVVAIDRCLLAREKINAALQAVRTVIPYFNGALRSVILEESEREEFGNQVSLGFILDDEGFTIGLDMEGAVPAGRFAGLQDALSSIASQYIYTVRCRQRELLHNRVSSSTPIGHFSQVNPEANELLIEKVSELLLEPTSFHATKATPSAANGITDLYAGYGNFALALAARGISVTAVEVDLVLARHGEQLAAAASLPIRFYGMSCEKFIARHRLTARVLLDPPRSGARALLDALLRPPVERIIYVSCNLPSLTRDLRVLASGGYELVETYLLDMFAQTHHVETISLLLRDRVIRP